MFEMIVDVHRLAEVSQIFLSHAVSQLARSPRNRKCSNSFVNSQSP